MTQRKPAGLGWESWIDRQIREATERGEFDGLPGAGEPIPDLDKPFDELWWVKRKLHSEGLTYQPPSVALARTRTTPSKLPHAPALRQRYGT
jgi:hypothetical protein